MPSASTHYSADLRPMLVEALDDTPARLEAYLTSGSNLPGPRMNIPLASAIANEIAVFADSSLPRICTLLDGWAALPASDAPSNSPREILPAAAALAHGRLALRRADLWDAEIAKLKQAASDSRWRTRELVATAIQGLLAADWTRTLDMLSTWAEDADPLVVRAAAAAVAEPPLLTDAARASNALEIQAAALARFAAIPSAERREEPVRVLRQALGFTLSVAVAADPDAGVSLLQSLSASDDPDLQWILRENLKKARLAPYKERLCASTTR